MSQQLIDKARAELLTRPGEPFNAPERVQRLADLLAEVCNALEAAPKKKDDHWLHCGCVGKPWYAD